MAKFTSLPSPVPTTVLVYKDGKFMGSCMEYFGLLQFQQYSNDGNFYDKELAKEYLIERGAMPETFTITDGRSTKTQIWFKITAKKVK